LVEFFGRWMAERWLAEGRLVLTGVSGMLARDWPGEGLATGTPRSREPKVRGWLAVCFWRPRSINFI
jgi:hypothetical protein